MTSSFKITYYLIREIKYVAKNILHIYHILHILKLKEQLLKIQVIKKGTY